MQTELGQIITDEIAASGPMRLDRYMALALAHPEHGYYMSGRSFGVEGDFITAPEISQIFGELLGLWSFDQMQHQQILDQAGFFELGPGRGTLMADATRAIAPFTAETALPIHMLEISPALKKRQQTALAPHPITHHDDLSALPKQPLVFFANEFFDALPIRQFIHLDEGWQEKMVAVHQGALSFINMPITDGFKCPDLPKGSIYEIAPDLPAIIDVISQHINAFGGAALIIDYGKTNAIGDSLQAVHDHKPVDILDRPGAADLSAWVDFAAIAKEAKDAGAMPIGPVNQGDFLKALGLYERAEQLSQNADPKTRRMLAAAVDRLSSPAQMGSLFQVLAILPSSLSSDAAHLIPGFMPQNPL